MGGNQRQASSRLGGLKGAAASGDIVEVHGGRIVRSTGRKDRHSKVCTAKGPRDRRVRLAADTAIQFYDVQDRLGYDRPSKAVDWLMKKAKSAIEALAQLPAWDPRESHHPDIQQSQQQALDRSPVPPGAGSRVEDCGDFGRLMENGSDDGSGFLTPSLDSDSIADTIKSLFPKGGSGSGTTTTTSCLQFQSYPPSPDLISRSTSINQSQDLSLSLQSLADPNLLHHHQSHHRNQNNLFSGFDALGMGWNSGGSADTVGCGSGGGGTEFSSALPPLPVLFGQSGQLFCQRGPLQSSYTPSIRAWFDPSEHQYYQFPPPPATTINNQSLISGMGLGSSTHSGFQIPARIRGEEDHDGGAAPSKPSSVSSDSRH